MKAATERLITALDGRLPETALILGSGLGDLAGRLADQVVLRYEELEGFPQSRVSGHGAKLICGLMANIPVIVLSGRVHYYETGDPAGMRLPLETLKAVGIRNLICTNSAGSLRQDMPPGSVMMISDHINWSGTNPLIGEESDARFVSMTNAYDKGIATAFRRAAEARTQYLHEGVYMWFSGPSFETAAEIRLARLVGADAVGMSTVPEIILGRFLGLNCAAFSVITNYAAGMTGDDLSHEETKTVAPEGGRILSGLIEGAIKEIST